MGGGVIGPRDNVFSGPAVALDGPVPPPLVGEIFILILNVTIC